MTDIKIELENKDDLDWFDAMCDLLKKDNLPTTKKLMEIIGVEKPNLNNEIRGSKILIPFDKRFDWASINPQLIGIDHDHPLDYLSFGGEGFTINMSQIVERFENFKAQSNTYDNGTQIFFYPVSAIYEFSGLDFYTDKEMADIENIKYLEFHNLTFQFGNKLSLGRDGYHLKR